MKLYMGDKEVKVGDKVKTFRGEVVKVTGMKRPHKPGSIGRVFLCSDGGVELVYYPGVINAEWKEA